MTDSISPTARIDSHHHLWAINDTDYVWMTDAHAAIRRDFLPADCMEVLAAAGIDGTVAVQARQMVDETEWLLGLADDHAWMRGVVGWVPLLEDAVGTWLEKFADHPKLRGVRHVVHDEPDDDFILRADFNDGIRRLRGFGLVYDLLIFWKHLPQTIRFVDQHPDQVFVLDHIGKPRISRSGFDREWADGLRELARRGNVSCKVSGMLTEVRDPDWDVGLLQPYFDTVLEAFGPERVMFGSDWPVLALRAGYGDWAGVAGELAGGLSADEQAAFWGGNATRIYGLAE